MLLAFLAEHRRLLRETVLSVTDDEARQRLVPSLTTPMGLLKHAIFVDTAWFVCRVVHAHQVLQHVADPVQALREMARVTKPGGLVAARD